MEDFLGIHCHHEWQWLRQWFDCLFVWWFFLCRSWTGLLGISPRLWKRYANRYANLLWSIISFFLRCVGELHFISLMKRKETHTTMPVCVHTSSLPPSLSLSLSHTHTYTHNVLYAALLWFSKKIFHCWFLLLLFWLAKGIGHQIAIHW